MLTPYISSRKMAGRVANCVTAIIQRAGWAQCFYHLYYVRFLHGVCPGAYARKKEFCYTAFYILDDLVLAILSIKMALQ